QGKLTSSKLALKLGIKTHDLMDKLAEAGLLEPRDGKHYITANLPASCGRAMAFEWFTQVRAVCRAGRRVERNRCAVRMTAKGSARPGMACRDRPVESPPQLGPAVGIHPAAGLLRAKSGFGRD
ncbi:MAG: hypothetical protein KAX58_10655, partial [Aeromonadaceae bacterium]|nr:hypothetical protein [Aeromonadaceae bacterium]